MLTKTPHIGCSLCGKMRSLAYAVCVYMLVISPVQFVNAALRTPEEAMEIAETHADMRRMKQNIRDKVALDDTAYIAYTTRSYYAVNTAQGYVLVAADDRMSPVLGYGDSGEGFHIDSLPPAMRYWLEEYESEYSMLKSEQSTLCSMVRPKDRTPSQLSTLHSPLSTAIIPPIVGCQWNQKAPYNLLAPCYDGVNHVAAGCVATAMAQVMYAYQYPSSGTGSHSYLWQSENDESLSATLTANFGATTYDWEAMLPSYTSSASENSQMAVATLMYHCGVAVDMGYDCNAGHESGAVTSKVPVALATYFGYDSHYQSIRKDIYPADSLAAILYDELALQHPILVSGQNSAGGHAFVCDGYDGKGCFHFNWGWGGQSDGYFLLSALNPGTQGVGGTGNGYNKNTTFFIGLQPQNDGAKVQPQQLAADSITVSVTILDRQTAFGISACRIQNYGMDNYQGTWGVALYDEDDTQMIAVLDSAAFSLMSGYYRTVPASFSNVSIPTTVTNGTYRLCCVYKDAAYGWSRMLCTQDDYYKTLYISDEQITFVDNHAPAELTLTQPIAFPADSVACTGAPLSFSVLNMGGTFRGEISARIYQGNFARGQYEIMDELTIRHDQTLTSALQQVFDANLKIGTTYKMKLCYRSGETDSWHDLTPAEYNGITFRLYQPQATDEEDPDMPSALQQALNDGAVVLSEHRVMALPIGILYVITIEQNKTIYHYKIIKPL